MVEGECIHRGNLIPKTAISSQKAALRESNSKRYGRSSVYTEEIWFPKRTFRARKQLYGNQISRGIVEGECIHIGNLIPKTALLSQKAALRESNFKSYGSRRVYTQRKFDSQNGSLEPERSFTGIKFQKDTKSYGAVKMFFPEPCSDACPTWQNNLKRNLRLPCARLGFKTGIAKAKKLH